MKCKICDSPLIHRNDKLCDACKKRISLALPSVKSFIDESFLAFVLSNREWLKKIIIKCNSDWHGGVTISAKQGELTHAKFFETDLI